MTRPQRLTLIATILGSTVVFLDSTVVNVALPAIQADLDTGLAGQQWVVEAYMLTLVSLLLVGGSLGDLYGRRRMFVIGLSGFAVTSVLCAIAPTDETLVAARALQGIAGALLVPGSLAILAATFEGEARGRAVGLWTAWAGISTLAGPAGGGLLVELDWRWIFWVNIPLIAATLWLTMRSVDESRDPEACPGIDWVGICLSAIGLAGPVFALIEQPAHGWGDPLVWAPLLLGVLSFAAFVWWESRARAPMLPLELFRSRNFSAVNLATLCVYAGLIGGSFFITLFLQQVAGFTAFQAGAATTPITIVMFVLSARFGAPRKPDRAAPGDGCRADHRRRRPGAARAPGQRSELPRRRAALDAALRARAGDDRGAADHDRARLGRGAPRRGGVGVNNAVSRVAGVLAIAVLGAIVSAQFASSLDERIGDRATGTQARAAIDDAKAQPLSGGDVSGVSGPEAAALGSEIVASSESAFHLGMLIGAGLMLLGGAIALALVRNPRQPAERAPERGPGAAATAGECGRPSEQFEPSPVPGTI